MVTTLLLQIASRELDFIGTRGTHCISESHKQIPFETKHTQGMLIRQFTASRVLLVILNVMIPNGKLIPRSKKEIIATNR